MATLGSITISISPTSGFVNEDFELTGKALDTTGAGIAVSGTVTAFAGDTSPIPWTSDASGAFSLLLSFTPAATYQVQAQSGAVVSNTLAVVISAGTTFPLTIDSIDAATGNQISGYTVNLYSGTGTTTLVGSAATPVTFTVPAGTYTAQATNTNNQGGTCTFLDWQDTGVTTTTITGDVTSATGLTIEYSCTGVSPPPSPVSPPPSPISPPPSPISPPSPPGTFSINVISVGSLNGSQVNGFLIDLYSDSTLSTLLASGNTPVTFTGLPGAPDYTIVATNTNNAGLSCAFTEWDDGVTGNTRSFEVDSTTGDAGLTAVYTCAASPPGPPGSPPPPSPTGALNSIDIGAVPSNPTVGQTVTISGICRDVNSNLVVGATGTLTEDGIAVANSTWTSGSTGAFTEPVAFTSTGTYTVMAVSGSIQSNIATVVVTTAVSPPPVSPPVSPPPSPISPPPSPISPPPSPVSPPTSVFTELVVVSSVNPAPQSSTVDYTVSAYDQFGNPFLAGLSGIITVLGIGAQAFGIPSGSNAVLVGFVMTGPGTFPVTATAGSVSSIAISQVVTPVSVSPPPPSPPSSGGGITTTDILILGGVAAVGIAGIAVAATSKPKAH